MNFTERNFKVFNGTKSVDLHALLDELLRKDQVRCWRMFGGHFIKFELSDLLTGKWLT